jgi:hypothetical protein
MESINEHADVLQQRKKTIESEFGTENAKLEWYSGKAKYRHIDYSLPNANVFDENNWDEMIDFFVKNLIKFETVMADVLTIEQ